MPKEAPEWQAHLASGYDGAMSARCDPTNQALPVEHYSVAVNRRQPVSWFE